MANSTTNLDTVSSSQAAKEVTLNAALDALSPASLFGRRATTTTGLTWGYYGGCLNVAGTPTQIANGTVALTASQTNYVEATTAGVVSANTSGFTAGRLRLYTVVTGASTVTSYTDHRSTATGAGITGSASETTTSLGALINGADAKTTPVDADLLPLVDSEASNIVKKLTWANLKATLKTYFDTLYATVSQPFDASAFYPGVPGSSAKILRIPIARAVTFAANFAGSYAKAGTAATGSTAIDIQKNGASVGTITFAAAGSTATFTSSGGTSVSFAAGDVLGIVAPGTADATLADIGITLAGTR